MNKLLLYTLTPIIAAILCGCGNLSTSAEVNSSEEITIGSLFFEDEEAQENKQIIMNYGLRINSNELDLVYDNGLVLPLLFENGGSEFKAGLLVFVDGILQTYASDVSEEECAMQYFTLPPNSPFTCELYINNIDGIKNYSDSVIDIISVAMPDYSPAPGELNFGLYHSGGAMAFNLNMRSEPEIKDYLLSADFESHVITEEERTNYFISDSPKTSFLLVSSGEDRYSGFIAIPENENSLDLNLRAFNTAEDNGDYRISVYKNHKQIKFNGGYDYIDVSVKDGFMTTADILLDDISAGDFIYCVAVPLLSETDIAKRAVKGDSMLIINESDIPEAPEYDPSAWEDYIPSDIQ